MATSEEDEFEKYRSRAYSAGSRMSARPTRSLPGTPRVKKYTLLQSLCGAKTNLDDLGELGSSQRSPEGRQLSPLTRGGGRGTSERWDGGRGTGDRSPWDGGRGTMERLPGDGMDSPPDRVGIYTVLHQPPGVLRHEVEPFRRAYSMKHHRPLPSRIHNTLSSNTISSSSSSGSSGGTRRSPPASPTPRTPASPTPRTPASPPGRTDSPTPNSWRGRSPNRPKDLDLGRNIRPRTSSMPSRTQYRRPDRSRSTYDTDRSRSTHDPDNPEFTDNPTPFRRVRSFKSTPKGIINRGDSIKSRKAMSGSQASLDSVGARGGGASGGTGGEFRPRTLSNASSRGSSGVSRGSSLEHELEQAQYQVIMVGSQGVGKTALSQQFTTSEYMGNVDTSDTSIGDEDARVVPVLLDGEESILLVIDSSGEEDPCMSVQLMPAADAYVVVYSVTDRETFEEAIEVLHEIGKDPQRVNSAVILVANKGDIVRNRTVTVDEAKVMAVRYDVKYIEVSAVLNHKVDQLLAGILSQIRLKQRGKKKSKCLPDSDTSCVQGAARGIMGKLFKHHPYVFRSCDNLMVL